MLADETLISQSLVFLFFGIHIARISGMYQGVNINDMIII